MSKDNVIQFPKSNIREVKIRDIANDIANQMTKIKEQRDLIGEQKKYIIESILHDSKCEKDFIITLFPILTLEPMTT